MPAQKPKQRLQDRRAVPLSCRVVLVEFDVDVVGGVGGVGGWVRRRSGHERKLKRKVHRDRHPVPIPRRRLSMRMPVPKRIL